MGGSDLSLLIALIHSSAWKANSRKFSCRILHKPSSRGAGPAPTGLHAACGGIYMSWWRIKMRSPAYGRTADEGEMLSLDGCWKPQDEVIGDPGRRIVLRLRFVPAPPVADRGLMRIPESLFATTTCVPCARRVKNLGSHLRGLRGRSMHDFASEFPRKTLLGTRVNKGERMSRWGNTGRYEGSVPIMGTARSLGKREVECEQLRWRKR